MRLVRKVLIIFVWLGIWQIASDWTGLGFLFASPVAVFKTLVRMTAQKEFYDTILNSVCNIGAGFFAGLIAGTLFGVLAGRFKLFGEFITPLIQFMKSLPVAAFVILLLMWFGSGRVSVMITAMVVIPMIVAGVVQGIKNTDTKLLEMAQVFHMTSWIRFRYIYFPETYPYVIAQLKVSLGMCFKAGVSAEIIGLASDTIGAQMYYAKIYLLSAELFAWSIVVIAVSYLFERLVMLIADAIFKWTQR